VAFTAETDDPYYQEGQRLVKQGRDPEALSAFLKVIQKRGEQASAESHLEAGLICLNHIKDPIEAIHHFRKYLELQPNAKQAPSVRGLIDTAKREFARTLPAHPLESQPIGFEQTEQVRQLQRENDELRAELGAQRTASTHAVSPLLAGLHRRRRSAVRRGAHEQRAADLPAPLPPRTTLTITVAPPAAPSSAPASAPVNRAAAASPASPGARKHTIVAGDTLYRISVKYFGNGSKVEAIFNANRDVIPNKNALPRIGTELKIP